MRIAVVGSGISGNVAARILAAEHEVDLYESAPRLGGHAHTVSTVAYGHEVRADVAFMVLNRRTYPNFCELLQKLQVETQPSDMSLSVQCGRTGLEFQGSSLNGLFAQRGNLLRPAFYRLLADIVRFNRQAIAFCQSGDACGSGAEGQLLGEFLDQHRLGTAFREQYLIPMSAAIWSADPASLDRFPARFILGFLRNHGLLQLRDRPQWLTIAERSESYVSELVKPIADRVHLNTPVRGVRRCEKGVVVTLGDGSAIPHDHVVMACHADDTLKMISDADTDEKEVLRGFPYQPNRAVLHTDLRVLPSRTRAWASWNYHIPASPTPRASVTYDLNRLQSLGLPGPLCLTLNPVKEIDPEKTLRSFEFRHPIFSTEAVRSQQRFDEINHHRGISYCGAYWGFGFHEDGVRSALAVTRRFGLGLEALDRSPLDLKAPRLQANPEVLSTLTEA